MGEIKTGELYAFSAEGDRKIARIELERDLQQFVEQRKHTKSIFGRKVEWLAREDKKYGDLFGLAEDKRLVIVEIKGRKSRGEKKIRYGLNQIKKKFSRIGSIVRSKNEFIKICKSKFGIPNPQKHFKTELHIDLKSKRLTFKPEFYLIATQLTEKVIRDAYLARKTRKVWRYRPKIRCININVLQQGGKKIIIMARYL